LGEEDCLSKGGDSLDAVSTIYGADDADDAPTSSYGFSGQDGFDDAVFTGVESSDVGAVAESSRVAEVSDATTKSSFCLAGD